MNLDREDLAELSRLIDQAMDLPADRLDAWLQALPPSAARLEAPLREALARLRSSRTDDFLASPAQLDAPARDDSVASPGDHVGDYVLLREIGRGGMGSVWLAEGGDGGLHRQVALKLPRLAWGRGLATRMARERDIGARLEHPHVARLYDAGVDHLGRPYLAMEYIDGAPIDTWCHARQLDVPARLRLFLQVLQAVEYAHGRQVVHRDLKPSNVLVGADGQARLLDFGIAKLIDDAAAGDTGITERLGRVMTPHYAAPEQLEGGAITVRTDVYSLGVLLFELLTGQRPYDARGSIGALEEAVLRGDAPRASSVVKDRALARQLHGDVDAIIAKAMRRDPAQRYASARAMESDIARHLEGRTITARPYSQVQRLRRLLRRRWKEFSVGALVLALLVQGGISLLLQERRAARAAERDRVVKQFVADVFRAYRGDRGTTAGPHRLPAQMLESSAEQIQTRFAAEPELQADLYGIVGGIFNEMGAHELAAAYAKREIGTLEAIHAPGRQVVLPLLIQAESQLEMGLPAAAQRSAGQALQQAEGDTALTARGLVTLARAQIESGGFDVAARSLDRIEALSGAAPAPLRRELAWVSALRAETLVRSNRLDEAFAGYERAVRLAIEAEGPDSISAASIRLLGARWYRPSGDLERTRQLFDPAIATLRAAGGAFAIRASIETARHWQQLYSTQQWVPFDQARAGIEASLAELSGYGDLVPAALFSTVQMWLARACITWGDVDCAARIAAVHGQRALAKAESPLERLYLLGTLALLAADQGRHDEASRLFELGRQARIAAGRGNHPLAIRDYHGLAVAAIMAGEPGRARELLRTLPKFEPIRGGSLRHLSERNLMLRARALLDEGDAEGALALVPQTVADPLDRNLMDGWIGSAEIRGEALCMQGRAREGLQLLQAHLAQLNPDRYEHAPKLAWQRAITGLCALRAGQAQVARQYAAQAQAAFTAQPGVSPYYKAALQRLQDALAAAGPAR